MRAPFILFFPIMSIFVNRTLDDTVSGLNLTILALSLAIMYIKALSFTGFVF